MSRRRVHLVGSMPFEDEPTAMRQALSQLGTLLASLPDGEIGERTEECPGGTRAAWVQTIMDRCEADSINWTVKRPSARNAAGFARDYRSGPRLESKHAPEDTAAHLDFGWATAARASYAHFVALREELGHPDLRFQVGLPTGMGATFAMMNPVAALRYASAFSERMATEANEILAFTDPADIVFQVEVPGELAMAYKLPKRLGSVAARSAVKLVCQIEPKAPIGVHLCFGDLNNKALIQAPSLDKAVNFTNALTARWPSTHELAYVHFPLAEAAEPPRLDRSYYEPLASLEIPARTRFVAGFVHPDRTLDELRTIRDHVESVMGSQVDIASSCGLGRAEPDTAVRLLTEAAALT